YLILIFTKVLGRKWAAVVAALVLSALFVSGLVIKEQWEMLFLGSFFISLFIWINSKWDLCWRGLGVAAWTHAIYDIMVIAFLS
ncbi:MAG: CPBP family intramembrane glutamate endopeptidase, partial [Gracilimonas sp.]|nr:CPBP family intramembrane glutamate endopeptidase [Gracilimonas sp.]